MPAQEWAGCYCGAMGSVGARSLGLEEAVLALFQRLARFRVLA